MNKEKNIHEQLTPQEDAALNWMEPGVTRVDRDALDPEMLPEVEELCSDLACIKQAVNRKYQAVDVENLLAEWHAKRVRKPLWRRAWLWSAAACAVVALVLLWPRPEKTVQELAAQLPPQAVHNRVVVQGAVQKPVVTAGNKREQQLDFSAATLQNAPSTGDVVRVQVPQGRTLRIALPDGSVVWLHPDAAITFPTAFAGKTREVILHGEAYFKVAHNSSSPFVVHTERLTTTVVGTEFSMRGDGNNNYVALIDGKVKVKAGQQENTLAPGQQLTCTNNAQPAIAPVDTEMYTYWRDGYFYFDNATLAQILEEVAAYYRLQVVDLPADKAQLVLRFVARRAENPQQLLQRLEALAQVKLTCWGSTLKVGE